MNTNEHKFFWVVGMSVVVGMFFAGLVRAGDYGVDSVMGGDPGLPAIGKVAVFDPKLKGLWMEALGRPEGGVRLRALEAIDVAAGMGMKDAGDFLPGVLKLMRDEKQDGAIRLAAARVAVDLDGKEAAGDLLAMDRGGGVEMTLVVDPALVKWKTDGAAAMWVERVKDGGSSDQVVRSAMRSLGAAGDVEAVAALRGVVMDLGRNSGTRAVAAEAIYAIGSAEAVEIAKELAGEGSVEGRLLAVMVLPASKDGKAVEMLAGLAQDGEAGVASLAVGKLMGVSRESLEPMVGKLVNHSDAVVRANAVEVLRGRGEVGDVAMLARLLNDLSPRVRGAARDAMIALDGKAELRDAVRKAAMERLNERGNWRATEQAALVLGTVGEAGARDKLVELMRAESKNVRLGAVVGLRRLKIVDTLPLELARAEELSMEAAVPSEPSGGRTGAGAVGAVGGKPKKPKAAASQSESPPDYAGMDRELSQLNQNLGEGKYAEAAGYLGKFVRKGSGWGVESRVAGIWALGKLHDGDPNAALAGQLKGRLADMDEKSPEDPRVKMMAAVSLARMRDKGAAAALTKGLSEAPMVKEACEWGLAYLEGKVYAGPAATEVRKTDWFLEPEE